MPDLIGKHAWRPLAREKLPIVADEAIDPKFGTGVLKVTPAHDKVDFEIGQRHQLPVIDVLHPDGRINCPATPELDGLDRFEARKKAAELLQERGLLAKTEPHENNVGFSERSEVPIEPRLSEQWFLRYPKTNEALAVVRDHLIRFFPGSTGRKFTRNGWRTFRIGASAARSGGGIGSRRGIAATKLACNSNRPGPIGSRIRIRSIPGFRRGSGPTRRWTRKRGRNFIPRLCSSPAPDIIFFWVARMIIAGLEFKPGKTPAIEDNIPFRDVFFTGLIRDKQGRKMSKSLGNSPDPLDLIAKYGADGLRFGLMRIAPSGQDIAFDEKQIEEGRNFATKLWNAARFRQMHGPSEAAPRLDEHALSIYALEVLARFDELLGATEAAYREYKFNEVAQRLYDFFWSDYCDWFIEAAKTEIFSDDEARKKSVLAVMDLVLSGFLRLLHPFMPHITEELWSVFGFGGQAQDIKASSIQFAAAANGRFVFDRSGDGRPSERHGGKGLRDDPGREKFARYVAHSFKQKGAFPPAPRHRIRRAGVAHHLPLAQCRGADARSTVSTGSRRARGPDAVWRTLSHHRWRRRSRPSAIGSRRKSPGSKTRCAPLKRNSRTLRSWTERRRLSCRSIGRGKPISASS